MGRIMLEFSLLTGDSENYNIINWALAGNIDRVFRAWGPILEAEDWISLGLIGRLQML